MLRFERLWENSALVSLIAGGTDIALFMVPFDFAQGRLAHHERKTNPEFNYPLALSLVEGFQRVSTRAVDQHDICRIARVAKQSLSRRRKEVGANRI
jgi:hypothetical protein